MFMVFLVYCIVSLFNDVFALSPALRDIFHALMACLCLCSKYR